MTGALECLHYCGGAVEAGEGNETVRPRWFTIAVTALTATTLAGCADRPNELSTYDDETTASASPSGRAPASSVSPSTTRPPVDPAALDAAVAAAVLTDADVAGEGVSRTKAYAAAKGCLSAIPLGLVAQRRKDVAWVYPSGSTLEQRVTAYPEHRAAEVLAQRVRCEGERLRVAVDPTVDGHAAWCAQTRCTVLFAEGRVLSGVQVDAGKRVRAAEAITRLTPAAAARLTEADPQP